MDTPSTSGRRALSWLVWICVGAAGAAALATIALHRGETINALWLVVAAVCVYLIAYRFYGLFVANKVLGLDPNRPTPAQRRNDGLDYVPTNKYVLFGHHFAAIAGAGPLVGPVLAAQMGYLPGTLWLLAGVVFAGAVQDFVVLFISTRRDGRSLGDMIRSEMGALPGTIAMVGVLMIMVILLAVLAGTRVARFMIQDLLGSFVPAMKNTESWAANLTATGIAVTAWGYFLYQGVVDPLGGVNTLWPLFGISNQMLAAIALTLCTVILFKMKREKYAWVTIVPCSWLLICTLVAGWQKLFHDNPAIGFLAHAKRFSTALAAEQVLAPAKSLDDMGRVVFNDYVNASVCLFFIVVVLAVVFFGFTVIRKALAASNSTVQEVGTVTGPIRVAAA